VFYIRHDLNFSCLDCTKFVRSNLNLYILADALDKGLKPDSCELQVIIKRHYRILQKFYDSSKELHIGFTDLCEPHRDFKEILDVYHPKMIEFIIEAMRHYENKNL
jgi:hypothetical protein